MGVTLFVSYETTFYSNTEEQSQWERMFASIEQLSSLVNSSNG